MILVNSLFEVKILIPVLSFASSSPSSGGSECTLSIFFSFCSHVTVKSSDFSSINYCL